MVEKNDLKSRHKVSFGGIFRNGYTIKKILNSFVFWGSLVLTILLGQGVFLCNKRANCIYGYIDDLASTVLTAFPSLLGFSLAGYALIIGASDTNIIGRMSEPLENNNQKLSYFQVLSCIFASSVIIQCITLILAFCVHLIVKQRWVINNEVFCYWTNIFVYEILLFAILFSLLLLCSTVVNLFTYGQTVHFCVRLDKEEMAKNGEDGFWKELKEAIVRLVFKYMKNDE